VPKPFDATLKYLIEAYPADWLRLVGLQGVESVDVVDADLSTVTAAADKLLRVNAAAPWLVNLEPQASYEVDLGERALRYSVLANARHHLPVQSIVVLLRPEADGREMSGIVQKFHPDGRCYLEFHYDVIRVWQLPVETILACGVGVPLLAPLAKVSKRALPQIIRTIDERFTQQAAMPSEAGDLRTATHVLMGLRYTKEFTEQLFRGVRGMKESVTYQAILEEGRAEEARKLLLLMGVKRFGPPDEQTLSALEAVTNIAHLEQLSERLLDVSSWDELLTANRRRRRKKKE
jgi:predicted transposase YdaD